MLHQQADVPLNFRPTAPSERKAERERRQYAERRMLRIEAAVNFGNRRRIEEAYEQALALVADLRDAPFVDNETLMEARSLLDFARASRKALPATRVGQACLAVCRDGPKLLHAA